MLNRRTRQPRRRPARYRPQLEGLEIRNLPATLTVTGLTFSAIEGAPTTGRVATFTDSDQTTTPADFTNSIDFGDGTAPVSGLVVQNMPGVFEVDINGSHVFPEESGSVVPPFAFTVTVTVTDTVNILTNSATSSAQVPDANLHQGNPVTAGTPTEFSGVGTANVTSAQANFRAAIGGSDNGMNPPQSSGFRSINWDGVKTDGTDFGGGANTTVITQNHTVGIPLNRFQSRGVFFGAIYAVSNDGFVDVNPSVAGLFPAFSQPSTFAMFNDNGIDFHFVLPSSNGTALVPAASRGFGAVFINVQLPMTSSIEYFHNDTSLGKFFVPMSGPGQQEFLGELFSSPIVTSVTLTLGTDVIFKFDGTTSTPGIADSPATGHNLAVVDDWSYAEPTALQNGAPITGGPQGTAASAVLSTATSGMAFNGLAGSFSDEDPMANAKDYTATINWGDGHISNGTISANSSGGFDVKGKNTYANSGLFPVSVDVMDFGGAPTLTIANTINVLSRVVAVGADAGSAPEVKVYDGTTGALKMDFMAYSSTFLGGVRVAVADVNGDGVPDIITAPGAGGGPDVRVFDGTNGNMIADFFAYSPVFQGGVTIAATDLNGDVKADIITGPGPGGGPDVRVFLDNNLTGAAPTPNFDFLAYDPSFVGGVTVAVGTFNNVVQIVTGPGAGGGPDIRVFTPSGSAATMTAEFFAYSPTFDGGVFVATGDVNGDGVSDIITGAGPGGGPEVKAFNGTTLSSGSPTVLDDFFAYASTFLGGVRVAAASVSGDGMADIITGAGSGGGPHVRIFDGTNGQQLQLNAVDSFIAFDPSFTGGVFVGGQ